MLWVNNANILNIETYSKKKTSHWCQEKPEVVRTRNNQDKFSLSPTGTF